MKFQGKEKTGCQCKYCIGTGYSKACQKAIKHNARQDDKKIIKKQLEEELVSKPGKKNQ